jgi:hypothetical protein
VALRAAIDEAGYEATEDREVEESG